MKVQGGECPTFTDVNGSGALPDNRGTLGAPLMAILKTDTTPTIAPAVPKPSAPPPPPPPPVKPPVEDRIAQVDKGLAQAGVSEQQRKDVVRDLQSASQAVAEQKLDRLEQALKAPDAGAAVRAELERTAKAGGTSSYEAYQPNRGVGDVSLGRGTNDDSIGRGTNDDSIGRGTNDDSIGRGTNDDSIGGAGVDGEGRDVSDEQLRYDAATAGAINREGLSPAANEKIDAILKGSDAEKARAAAYALNSDAYAGLPADQREQFVNVLAATDARGATRLARLCEKRGDALYERATDGSSTLDNLARLAQAPNGQRFLSDAIADIVNPRRIWQGNAPTCTAATMQYDLAKEKPAEYARLLSGLVTDGRVTMAGGGELAYNANTALLGSNLHRDRRSPTEALFQTAVMEFANGADTYNVLTRQSRGDGANGHDTQYRGLYADQIRTMTGQLFGVQYQTREVLSDAQALAELQQLPAQERANRPVLFDLDYGSYNHCVAFEGVSNGQVRYRDPETGRVEQMSTQEFIHRLVAVHSAPTAPPPAIPASVLRRMMID